MRLIVGLSHLVMTSSLELRASGFQLTLPPAGEGEEVIASGFQPIDDFFFLGESFLGEGEEVIASGFQPKDDFYWSYLGDGEEAIASGFQPMDDFFLGLGD